MTPSAVLRSLGSFSGRNRALHLSWLAFFASFLVWFNFAPFSTTIGRQLHLSAGELATVGLCNLGLTVPARLLVGIALDRFGPRRVFPTILIFGAIPNTVFAVSSSFSTLVFARLAMSVVGGGFVVGIRMIAEWWPKAELGTAEGLYGGWGNFGGGVATVGLPALAAWIGGPDGWRWAIGLTGVIAAAWGVMYFVKAEDTAAGTDWVAPARQGALEVTSRGAVIGLALLTFPVVGVLGLIAYRIELVHVISHRVLVGCLVVLMVLAAAQVGQVLRVNRPALASAYPVAARYPFRAVVVCCLAYSVTFGGELAMLSILPTFYGDTWHLGVATAGAAAGTLGLMNLVTRPSGGILSDSSGRRRLALVGMLAGVAVGFGLMSLLHERWPVVLAVLLGVGASAFLQGGSGATFAVVPQIAPRVGGQVAGLAGAYGNIGGIVLLFLLLYVTPQHLFLIIGASAVVAGALVWRFLPVTATVTEPAVPPDTAQVPVADRLAVSR
jgi:NNP family nitrate/nitrite transporter-like MFS transporter